MKMMSIKNMTYQLRVILQLKWTACDIYVSSLITQSPVKMHQKSLMFSFVRNRMEDRGHISGNVELQRVAVHVTTQGTKGTRFIWYLNQNLRATRKHGAPTESSVSGAKPTAPPPAKPRARAGEPGVRLGAPSGPALLSLSQRVWAASRVETPPRHQGVYHESTTYSEEG